MPDGVTVFDHSTWLAKRVKDAASIGEPEPPQQVALPGARQAIPHDRLVALQEAGRDEHAIIADANKQWRWTNAERLRAHAEWVNGAYTEAIVAMREKAACDAAEKLRREALFERFLAAADLAEAGE